MSRPSLQPKHTRKTEAKRNDELDQGISIQVDGTVYTVRIGDLSSLDTMALRKETGFSFRGLMASMQSDPDVDLIAAIVWLSRRIDGEVMLSYADVARDIGYDVDVDLVSEPAEDDRPEA